jgi:putative ABC transport system substrate-binding protein
MAAVWLPLAVEAQRKTARIGLLWGTPTGDNRAVFERALRDLGWIEGHNLTIEFRTAEGQLDRLPALAGELVAQKVDVLVALAAPETRAAKQATTTIPVVFVIHGDPVGTGAVQSLARPGGNTTGLSQMHPQLAAKQLQILKDIVPGASRVGVLWNASNAAKVGEWRELQPAAEGLGLSLDSHEVRRPADLDGAFASIRQRRPDALLTLSDPLTATVRWSIAEFAVKERLPAMYALRPFAEAGGLVSYGADLADLHRRAAGHVDKILRGAKPADLPVEQARKFELVVNLKAAKAIGLTMPQSLLLRADHVIQ